MTFELLRTAWRSPVWARGKYLSRDLLVLLSQNETFARFWCCRV